MGFKENLKAELKYKNMLVKELSVLSGVNLNTINNYLNTRNRMPSADVAVKIARVLGVSVEYLITGVAEKQCGKPFLNTSLETRLIAQCTEQMDYQTKKMLLTMIQALPRSKQTAME